jgi:hypothetical protein
MKSPALVASLLFSIALLLIGFGVWKMPPDRLSLYIRADLGDLPWFAMQTIPLPLLLIPLAFTGRKKPPLSDFWSRPVALAILIWTLALALFTGISYLAGFNYWMAYGMTILVGGINSIARDIRRLRGSKLT